MKAHYNQTIKVITPFVIPLYESGPWCSAPGARLASPRWVRSRSPRCCKRALSVAHRSGATETKDLERVVVDTTVQEKAVAPSPDRRPAHPPRDREAGRSAKREGVELRQSYLRVAKRAAIMSRGSAGRRSNRCTPRGGVHRPRQRTGSRRVRLQGLDRYAGHRAQAGSSCCMPRHCTAILMTVIHSVSSSPISKSLQGLPSAASTATWLSRSQLSRPVQGLYHRPGPACHHPDLGSRQGTCGSSTIYIGDQHRSLLLRPAKPMAAQVQ